MQVKDLTVHEPKLLIQETVDKTIQSLLFDQNESRDPDEGKQIKPEVQEQLLKSLK